MEDDDVFTSPEKKVVFDIPLEAEKPAMWVTIIQFVFTNEKLII